ncbi:MAG: zinc ribbon domain-containing protein [Promethearchaeota archaeon]
MSVRAEILEGRVKQLVKSESGNLAFMLEDNQGNMQYCFSAGKKPILNSSDVLVLFGSYISGNKFRVSFILNKTKNTEVNLVETKSDWIYNGTLVLAILVTGVFGIYFIFSFFLTPVDPYGYNYVFSYIVRIVILVLLAPTMIILWILVAFFSKSRKKGSNSERETLKLKEEYYSYYNKASSTSTKKIEDNVVNSITKPNFCPNCGGKLPAEAKFCPSCGSEF